MCSLILDRVPLPRGGWVGTPFKQYSSDRTTHRNTYKINLSLLVRQGDLVVQFETDLYLLVRKVFQVLAQIQKPRMFQYRGDDSSTFTASANVLR